MKSTLTNDQIAREIKTLRVALDPIINLQYKELLTEVERRLKGSEPAEQGMGGKKKLQPGKRTTNRDAYNKYFNR